MLTRAISHGLVAAVAAWGFSSPALAQTTVQGAWVQGTVGQQKATGAFMTLTSPKDARLVGASSPVAGVVEVHEMKMDGDVMKMAAIAFLDLPAGKAVKLTTGGYHIMLMDLKQPLSAGQSVPLLLNIETADGAKEALNLKVPVRALGTRAAPPEHGAMPHHQ